MARPIARLRQLIRGRTDRGEERQILELLRESSGAQLNRLLAGIDLNALQKSLDDRLIGPDHRAALYHLLSRERLADLSIPNRARWVDALQKGITSRRGEGYIRDVFLGTRGEALTELKNAIDAGNNYHDVQQLLHRDIDDRRVRAEILAHIGREAKRAPAGGLKVLSDVDDTLYANWKDKRFPKKTVYPGVRSFLAELRGDMVFVTARPGVRTGRTERWTHATLSSLGIAERTVMMGALPHLLGNKAIARKKVSNFEQLHAIYPEYDFVFVGDNGQGDVTAGLGMAEAGRDAFKGAFIHDVDGASPAEKQRLAARGVHVFDTYVGAALLAQKQGLLGKAAVKKVVAATGADFAKVKFGSPAQKAAAKALLDRDLAAAGAR